MGQILLIGHGIGETQDIRRSLESHFPQYIVEAVPPRREEIKKFLTSDTKLTVLNYTAPLDTKKLCLHAVRDIGYGEFILVLSRIDDRAELVQLQKQKDVLLLEKPFESNDLLGLTEKILKQEKVGQRLHRRFLFNQTAGIESFGVSGKIAAQIKRISKGGALLQLKGHALLNLGDLIQVHIQLDKPKRYHLIPARVVNAENGGLITANEHFGVEWLPQLGVPKVA